MGTYSITSGDPRAESINSKTTWMELRLLLFSAVSSSSSVSCWPSCGHSVTAPLNRVVFQSIPLKSFRFRCFSADSGQNLVVLELPLSASSRMPACRIRACADQRPWDRRRSQLDADSPPDEARWSSNSHGPLANSPRNLSLWLLARLPGITKEPLVGSSAQVIGWLKSKPERSTWPYRIHRFNMPP